MEVFGIGDWFIPMHALLELSMAGITSRFALLLLC